VVERELRILADRARGAADERENWNKFSPNRS